MIIKRHIIQGHKGWANYTVLLHDLLLRSYLYHCVCSVKRGLVLLWRQRSKLCVANDVVFSHDGHLPLATASTLDSALTVDYARV